MIPAIAFLRVFYDVGNVNGRNPELSFFMNGCIVWDNQKQNGGGIMRMSAALTIGAIIIIVILMFASAWSLDVPVVIALIISVFSAGAAGLSALFAWRSIAVANKQNTIAAQTALLESLVHERAALEDINLHLNSIKNWSHKKNVSIIVQERMGNSISEEERGQQIQYMKIMLQKNSSIIFCYRHYFADESSALNQLYDWYNALKKTRTIDEIMPFLESVNPIILEFINRIIPDKLAKIQEKIKDLNATFERASK